jgi:hypothetical protein
MMNKARKIGLLGIFAAAIAFFVAPSVQAQLNTGIEFGAATGLGGGDIRFIVGRIIQAFLGILGIIALVLVVYAGFLWMTAGGDEDKVTQAKRILTQAVIGLAIILASFSITTFVVSRLFEATGANGGGGGGNGDGGGGGGLGGAQFTVQSITPPGGQANDFLWPMNSLVRVVFRNGAPDPATAPGSISVMADGVPVSGTISSQGNSLVFTPTAACPTNPAYTCLPGNADFTVTVASTVESLSGRPLFCGNCSAVFRTGDFIDTQNPTVSIAAPGNGQSVPVDSFVQVVAQAQDDSAVAEVAFTANDSPIGSAGNDPWQVDWDTTGIPVGTSVTLRAQATDAVGNEALASPVTVTVRPTHCFNAVIDGGETGLNCGDGCGECAAGACTRNSDCASGLCENGRCLNRPRIDSVAPLSGGPGTLVTIGGASFGSAPGGVLFLGSSAEGDERSAEPCAPSAWTDTQIIVSLPEGTVNGPIRVTNGDNLSDRTDDDFGNVAIPDFAVNSEVRPGICALTPNYGPSGTSVQIAGIGFGDAQGAGEVTVAGRSAAVASWSGSSITMAVPNMMGGTWPVIVTTGGADSNGAAFSVPAGNGVPHISAVDPGSGPIGEYVTLSGSSFGNTPGRVNFVFGADSFLGSTDFPPACGNSFWRDTLVTIKVPNGLPLGSARISLTRSDGVGSDNMVDFRTVAGNPRPGICRLSPTSGPIGTVYEIDGERLGESQGRVVFRENVDGMAAITSWNASRISGAVPARAITGRVYAVSAAADQSNSLNFTVSDCRTASVCRGSDECCSDGTCREPNPDGSSGCQAMRLAGSYRYRFSTGEIPSVPTVVEEVSCAMSSQSPTPFRDVGQACANSVIGARFSLPMDTATLTAANFSLRECGREDRFDAARCAGAVAGAVAAVGGNQAGEDGIVFTPDAILAPNGWYEARIAAAVRSLAGVSMDNDYVWHFRVRNSVEPCVIDSVSVSPAVNRLTDIYSDATRDGNENKSYAAYRANPQDAVCNMLRCGDYAWNWSSSLNAAQIVNPTLCTPEVRALAETPVSTPAVISASAMGRTGTGELTVKFSDPQVVDKWPACQSACLEAQVAASFNIAVLNISATTVRFLRCNNETCLSASEEAGYTVEAQDAGNEHLAIIHPAASPNGSPLEANAYYRVIVVGGASGVVSFAGAELVGTNYSYGPAQVPAYSWVFRTSDSHCSVDSVQTVPAKIVTKAVGSLHAVSATPKTAPDNCSATGQRIDVDGLDFVWTYAPNPPGAADLFQNGAMNARPLASSYATAACLRSGTAAAAVCGDGIVENGRGVRKTAGREAEGGGEECDLGARNGETGSGCSENCLLTGNAVCANPSAAGCCGNSSIDSYVIANGVTVREQCDLGARNGENGSGCSRGCLRLGSNSVSPSSTCGNGDLADVEQCDLGRDNGPGSGCSGECLDEGSRSGGTSICGNGATEAGEDCDPPNGRTCSASCKNLGRAACSASGQSTCCGNGATEAGEDIGCDLGWDNANARPLIAPGCNASCLKTGASLSYVPPSICGDGAVGLGESFDPGAVGNQVDSVQFARAVGQGRVLDERGFMVSRITASVGDRTGTTDFELQCGYTRNSDCPANTYLGANSCCFPRPYPTIISPQGANVCRNPLIQVNFDREMDAASFTGNFTVTGPIGPSGRCPSAVAFMGPFERIWSKISSFFAHLFSLATGRPVQAQAAACTIPGTVTVQTVTVNGAKRAQVRYALKAALDANTVYTARIPVSVKSIDGVSPPGDIWWSFTTGMDICTLDALRIDPANALFTAVYAAGIDNPEAAGTFTAQAQHLDQNGATQPIAPVAGVYDWRMNWASSDASLVDAVSGNLSDAGIGATVGVRKAENGQVTLGAVATIVTDTLNSPSTSGHAVSGSADITVLLCKHPWPARGADGSWSPYVGSTDPAINDSRYGYSFYYCRDDADGNASLPELRIVPTVPANTADLRMQGILRDQYLYTYSADSVSSSPALKSEGIGLRIAMNPLHLSPTEWYSTQNFKGKPATAKVDGYEAIADGRTTYVSAASVDTGSFFRGTDDFTNIFAWSYTEGATSDTQGIFKQILNNMRFVRAWSDLNICSSDPARRCTIDIDCSAGSPGATCLADRSKIRRDVKRFADLRLIAETAQKVKDFTGAYPQLISGSYLTSRSVSTWPSWSAAFAQDLGGAPPVDPINKLGSCEGYDAATCWNAQTQTFACPVESHVYEYFVLPVVGFTLNYNRESSADFAGNFCSAFAQGRCSSEPLCYADRGTCYPRLNAVDACVGNQIGVKATTCGNGVIEAGEECEKSIQSSRIVACGNNGGGIETDSCGADCRWAAGACMVGRCGNGAVDFGERCDNGVLNGTYGHCNASCSGIGQSCGDGFVQPGEVCDNSTNGKTVNGISYTPNGSWNQVQGRGCAFDCHSLGNYCGDGKVSSPEQCDGASESSPTENGAVAACPNDANGRPQTHTRTCSDSCGWNDWDACQPIGSCGNGSRESNEQCDLGDMNSDNSQCLASCRLASCGDGYVWVGHEQCDAGAGNIDPNTVAGQAAIAQKRSGCLLESCYYCTATCRAEAVSGAFCGDGQIEGNEQCDDGASNIDSADRVRLSALSAGEQYCDGQCRIGNAPVCGDGRINPGESCDAGVNNGVSGSGCDGSCRCTGDGFYSGSLPGTVTSNPNYTTGAVAVSAAGEQLGWWPTVRNASAVWSTDLSPAHQYFRFPFTLTHPAVGAKMVIGADNEFRAWIDNPSGQLIAASNNYQQPQFVDIAQNLGGATDHVLYIEAWNYDGPAGLWFAIATRPDCQLVGALASCYAFGNTVLSDSNTMITSINNPEPFASNQPPSTPINAFVITNPGTSWSAWNPNSSSYIANDPRVVGASWIWYSDRPRTFTGCHIENATPAEHVIFTTEINLPGGTDNATINLMADDDINIGLNGAQDVCPITTYCTGACSSSQNINNCTITENLRSGPNTITFDVANFCDTGGLLFKATFGSDCGLQ